MDFFSKKIKKEKGNSSCGLETTYLRGSGRGGASLRRRRRRTVLRRRLRRRRRRRRRRAVLKRNRKRTVLMMSCRWRSVMIRRRNSSSCIHYKPKRICSTQSLHSRHVKIITACCWWRWGLRLKSPLLTTHFTFLHISLFFFISYFSLLFSIFFFNYLQ